MSNEVLTNHCPKTGTHLRGDDLSTFGAEITAEALKVRTEEHDVTAQVFVNQVNLLGRRRQRGSALEVNLLEPRHPVILPE